MVLSGRDPARGAGRRRKRMGRGPGSGQGKTATRGETGRGARSGGSSPPGYEGGQMPLQRRLPKRGFRNPARREYAVVNIKDLERKFAAGETVDPARLRQRGLVRRRGWPVKVLGDGALGKALTVRAHRFTRAARERIVAAGGKAEEAADA